jgi:hypothetical protein
MMTKAQTLLLSLNEERIITVALHNPVSKNSDGEYYTNADIFGFELWDVPYNDTVIKGKRISTNYAGLFNNLTPISKKEIKKYNSSKQRISFERARVEKVFIPDKVWNQLKIYHPRSDQKIFMQCLYLLFKNYNVRIVGIEDFWS